MRLELGCPVRCGNAAAGEFADVVIDPTRQRVTHLVVDLHDAHRVERLVPVELAYPDETSAALVLGCTIIELLRLAPVEEFLYLRADGIRLRDPTWELAVPSVLAHPYYEDFPRFDPFLDFGPRATTTYERIPKDEIEIRRASAVFSSDGHRLGRVDGLLVDRDDHLTHVVLERGHLYGRREVTVPINAVAWVAADAVALDLSWDEVGRLPAVAVHRWTALLAPPRARLRTEPTLPAA